MANDTTPDPASKVTRVVLVDDHPMVRERLAELFQREADLSVCGEADDHRQALDAIAATRPDLAIIDLTLKNSNGLELIKDIHRRWPHLVMLVVSMHDESLHAERVIRAGAMGYITKQEATRRILQAVRAVLRGQIYLSGNMATEIASKTTRYPRAKSGLAIDRLSAREVRVFELLGQGFTTREIAKALRLDIRTVETYRARIKDKLQLKHGNDLLQRAIRWIESGGAG